VCPVRCIPCLVSVSLTGDWLPGVEEYERELTAGYEEDGDGGLDESVSEEYSGDEANISSRHSI